MFSVAASAKYALKGTASSRSFATVKRAKPFYRKVINTTTVGIATVGGIAWYAYKNPYDKGQYLGSLDQPTAYEIETLTPKQVAFHTILLNRTGSRLMGKLAQLTLPVSWRRPIYSYVSKLLGIDVTEIKGSFEDYPTPNSFFTRDLKPESRPIIHSNKVMLSPVDGTVSVMEEHIAPTSADDVKLHQVKGVSYSLKEFISDNYHLKNEENNLYSTVIYLAPSNYHHIHNPIDISITDRVHIPGALLPVKQSYVQKVKGLFTLNERVVLSGNWQEGFFSLGMVGAYNVGSIRITNPEDPVTTNKPHELIYSKHRHHKHYRQPWEIPAGDRVGTFELGSTVVMAFEAPAFHWLVEPGTKVKMGQPIGYVGDRTEEVDTVLTEYEALMETYKRSCEKEKEDIVTESERELEQSIEEVVVEVEEVCDIIPEEEGEECGMIPEEEKLVEERIEVAVEDVVEEVEEDTLVCEVADAITELTAIVQVIEEHNPVDIPNKEIEEVLEEMDWNLSKGEREEYYW